VQHIIFKSGLILSITLFIPFYVIAQETKDDQTAYIGLNTMSILAGLLGIVCIVLTALFYYNLQRVKQIKIKLDEHRHNNSYQNQTPLGFFKDAISIWPYAACISDEKHKIICANQAFLKLAGLQDIDLDRSWDEYLKIDLKTLNISADEFIANSQNNTTFKVKITPLKTENLNRVYYTILIEDISLVKSQTKDTKQRQAYFKNVISKSSLPIIMTDNNCLIIEANQQAYDTLEVKDDCLTHRNLSHYLSNAENRFFLEDLKKDNLAMFANGIFYICTSSKKKIPIELNVIPVDYFGSPAYFFLLKDISERIHIEHEILKAKVRAEESDRLKSSFLANMSHEVRTPLNSIMGFTELMSDEHISPTERREFHQIVKASSNELLELLNDIMEYSKIESGLLNIKNEKLQTQRIFKELQNYALKQISKNSGLSFKTNEPIGLKEVPDIITDAIRVKQVLRYLIDNAIKFTYTGSISLAYHYRPDNTLEFIVSDTGIGIPQEKIPNIFHKFRQVNDENSRIFGGAGLGLSICKNLANALGGFLWVSSVEQKGSHFHFVLPHENEMQLNSAANTIIFYSKKHASIPKPLSNVKYLALFDWASLLSVPLAHRITVILLDEDINPNEKHLLLQLPQIQSTPIIVHNNTETKVIYSPLSNEIDLSFTNEKELKNYLLRYCEGSH